VLLLAIDTSTPTVTAGVVTLLRPHEMEAQRRSGVEIRPVELLAEQRVTNAFAHAEQLMPLVSAALADSGHRLGQLDAVVVGLGPGPFTGLRVGVATAVALGDALDIPVHGVGSHDAAARADLDARADVQAPAGVDDGPSEAPFLVVTDARRREVYLSAYSAQGRRLFGPAPVAPAAVAESLAEADVVPRRMIGAGSSLLADLPDVEDAEAAGSLSVGLVLAAARDLLTGAVPGPLTPLYLRRPDATVPGPRKSVLGA
jgi:tRNA threonylcarbamoyl adenosine modification protein YeaZ